jgi:catechol 2,3-dioxygenase-like lactoylglutathione lyase family enzyme
MKRLHVHVSVDDFDRSIWFYSTSFAAGPNVLNDDYAKWVLEDPRVNFAIGKLPGRAVGISHLGIQAEDENELGEVYDRLSRIERPILEAKRATCCYARSDGQRIADPRRPLGDVLHLRRGNGLRRAIARQAQRSLGTHRVL